MALGNVRSEIAGQRSRLLLALVVLALATGSVWAQMTATMTGTVKDTSGAIIPEAAVTVKHVETGAARLAQTDQRGNYRIPALPVGQYEVTAERNGFKMAVRRGITLVVGQEAVVDLTLEVGSVEQQVTVTAEAPLVNTTVSSTAGLVGEKQMEDLPLNGRSFDQLLTLNAGTSDYTSQSTRNSFSVSGRRPDENRFTINGVEYVGSDTSGQWTTPAGTSGQLLGVDAMREFNVQTDAYGAEYGKKAGGQVAIVTKSGTNELHGSAFHYLRNNALDARNFFDDETPPFRRNQFGGSLGGPIKRDKLFVFGSYEGFRQRLGGSGQAVVPDLDARRGFLPTGPGGSLVQVPDLQPRMLEYMKLWYEPNRPSIGGGAALRVSNPVEAIREDFGLLRVDYNISDKDALSGTLLMDDGTEESPSNASPDFSTSVLKNTIAGIQETRIFSPSVVNVLTVGFSRGLSESGGRALIDFPQNLRLFEGSPSSGSIRIGGSIVAGVLAISAAGVGAVPQRTARTNYTLSDDVHYTRGSHAFSFGAYVQRVHDNTNRGTNLGGAITYATLQTMLQDRPTTLAGSSPGTPVLGYRYTQAAFYLQDEIKLRSNLTLRLGLREDSLSSFNEVADRAANYWFDQNQDLIPEPHVGKSILKENNNKFIWQPRVGLAWDPTGTGKWSVRAGWGLYSSIMTIFSWRLTNPPFKGLLSINNTPLLSFVPIPATAASEPSCTAERVAAGVRCRTYSPNGVFSTYKTPKVSEWNFSIEREIVRDLMFRIGYNGSQGYHSMTNTDANTIRPLVCNSATCTSGGVLAASQRGTVTQGMTYIPVGTRPSPYVSNTLMFFFNGSTSYHGLDVTLQKRFSQGFSFRTNYTFSKSLDLNSTPSATSGSNAPQTVLTRYDLKLSRGVSTFSAKNQFNANFSYELPLGSGKAIGGSATGFWNKLISGWQWNGILRARSGLPFTPTVGANRSGNGDSRVPDVPNRNPNYSGSLTSGTSAGCGTGSGAVAAGTKLGTPERFFDPCAFTLPVGGTFGNTGRSGFRGPGLFNVDTSLFKGIPLTENWNLQFRFEIFNAFNHTNFVSPNPITFSGTNYAPAAGRIIDTSTTARELQFALRLTF